MVSFRTALNVLFYCLLEKLGSLRPNFIQKFHGLNRRETTRDSFHVDVEWILELIIAIITFYYYPSSFCTGEVLCKLRCLVGAEQATKRCEDIRKEYEARLDSIAPRVSSLLTEIEKKEKQVDDSRGKEIFEHTRYQFDDFMRNEGVLVNIWRDISLLFSQKDPASPEDFDPNFFSTELIIDDCRFNHILTDSNSYALRSGESQRWRFNRTRKMIHNAKCCPDALCLVKEYELMIFNLSSTGTLHWIFQTTRSIIREYNDRTMDPSKWLHSFVVRKETKNEAHDPDVPSWGWNEKEKLPGKPSNDDTEERKVLYVIVY